MINVTKTFLPNKKRYISYIDQLWESGWITNNGKFVTELEKKLKDYLGVKHLFLVNNGTIALQIAIKSLNMGFGEIITTPFSYVATTSSIVWEGYTPIFCDIDENTLTIDSNKIERLITNKTRAILATHVYGIPCDVKRIAKIANKYNLKVIYDAAHSFGVNFDDESILKWGDISALSFHATKLFHTIEGGAITTENDQLAKKIDYMRNFGHKTPTSFHGLGINGKMNEFSAAMGLSILPEINRIIKKRKRISDLYDSLLKDKIARPKLNNSIKYNYPYYPIIFKNEKILKKIQKNLNNNDIFPRRYFYPSLNTLNYVKYKKMPISEDMSKRVLCLPLSTDLTKEQVELICNLI